MFRTLSSVADIEERARSAGEVAATKPAKGKGEKRKGKKARR
jgi:hypothetical protein